LLQTIAQHSQRKLDIQIAMTEPAARQSSGHALQVHEGSNWF